MELVTPGIGLIFWTSVVFIVLIILLKKFAWKPILEAVEKRSNSIEEALNASEKAKAELTELNDEKDKLRKQALADRDALLKEAATTKAKIVSDAKAQAKQETEKILANAREVIKNKKMASNTKSQGTRLIEDTPYTEDCK
jgi:F-type H+-transporting ATPase subunit b